MDSKTVRQQFIDFFKDKNHIFVRSASLIPFDDPSLLFTNAGMNQFKNIFLGKESPGHPRVVNSQKCIRVSGKHNDLEEVGYDTYHHTFFEMLGNWSFGDYYKEEALRWAWELLVKIWCLPRERLWASVYIEDDEADELWKKVTDIDPDRVLRFGAKDNYWEMGDTGPCGPCSEIHYYVGKDLSKQSAEGVNNSDEYWELWNLVFIQNNRNADGSLDKLPQKHIDTGAGLERIAAVLQGKTSNYDTDLFQPIVREVERLTNSSYEENPIPHRVISDHVRMLSFAIADGVLPSNDGRGYVARRILRRASRFGRVLGKREPFIHKLVATVADQMGDTYPELVDKQKHVERIIEAEETSFTETVDRGLEHFKRIVSDLSGSEIPGEAAFRLYDTYGFPLDLTQQMAREKGLWVDVAGFEAAMEGQRERARSSAKFKLGRSAGAWIEMSEGDDSQFLGYRELTSDSVIRRYQTLNGGLLVVLDKTPFYAEAGGQIGDTGFLTGDGFRVEVTNTIKEGNSHVHIGRLIEGETILSKNVRAEVDGDRRQAIRLNHTATHLMHQALKVVLGDHVHQAGSLVAPDYLRFDLTHYEKISPEQIRQVEEIVNYEIRKNSNVDVSIQGFDEARKEGAIAIFEEKYGDLVRVITVGDFSKELCGGTHVCRTGDIGCFKIIEESALAAGVRRITAVTGKGAVDCLFKGFDSLSKLHDLLNCPADEVVERVERLLKQRMNLEKELKRRRSSDGELEVAKMLRSGISVRDYRIVVSRVEANDFDRLKEIGDRLLETLESGIGVLGTVLDSKPSLVCVVTQDLIEKGIKAGALARDFGRRFGGGGGGRAHLATAGGRDASRLNDVLNEIKNELVQQVKSLSG